MGTNKLKNRRIDFHNMLQSIFGEGVSIYFQPPENVKISYPCVIYERYDMPIKHADNLNYLVHQKYKVTIIDKTPDSELVDKITTLNGTKFSRHFVTDGLNHDVFIVYY